MYNIYAQNNNYLIFGKESLFQIDMYKHTNGILNKGYG